MTKKERKLELLQNALKFLLNIIIVLIVFCGISLIAYPFIGGFHWILTQNDVLLFALIVYVLVDVKGKE